MGTHNCWVEMMYLFFLLFLLGHRVQGKEKSCWHAPCDPDDVEKKLVTNGNAEVDVNEPEECQEACKKYQDGECKWFDFGGIHHPKKCVLLKEMCDLITSHNNHGVSGPSDCATDPDPPNTCKYSPGERTWECVNNEGKVLSPPPQSNDELLEETTCQTSCYGNKYTATCGSGGWDPLESSAADDEAHKTEIESPEKEGDCLCKEIKLSTDPNREPGAFFFCSEEFEFCQGSGLTTDINKGVCTLSCEGYQYVRFHCIDGAWYKDDESKPMEDTEIGTFGDDLYCYNEERVKCPKK